MGGYLDMVRVISTDITKHIRSWRLTIMGDNTVKVFLALLFIGIAILFVADLHEQGKMKPYDIGVHLDYTITCENGFKYKILREGRGGVIQLLDSTGKPLRCK